MDRGLKRLLGMKSLDASIHVGIILDRRVYLTVTVIHAVNWQEWEEFLWIRIDMGSMKLANLLSVPMFQSI